MRVRKRAEGLVGISVALCTLNGERHLRQQLDSIAVQQRLPDEIVVCDDGSTDGTVELVGGRLRALGLPHRLVQNGARLGVSRNFAQAIQLCEHDIVILSDQDDIWRADRLARIEAEFVRRSEVDLVFSNARAIDQAGKPLGYTQWDSSLFGRRLRRRARKDLLPVLLRYPVACGATMAVRRDMALRCLPVADEWLHDEWLAWLCAAISKVWFIDEELVDYRIHAGQVVGAPQPGFSRQLAAAKRMGQRYYEWQIRRFTRLRERLCAWAPRPRAEVLAALGGKLAYLEALRRLRSGESNPYWVSTALLLNGSHHRFELGFRSWLLNAAYNLAFGGPRAPRHP
jgi:glycosyltransferase involved in cell wall biosynthesis